MDILDQIDKNKLPKHVAVIMDGNGRWAKNKGSQRIQGHKQGALSAQNVVEAAVQAGIQYLTLYAFSTENWNRPKIEIDALMTLLVNSIHNELTKLVDKNIRLHTIGNNTQLPAKVRNEVSKAIEATKNNTGLNLIIALSYSSRWEITNAVHQILYEYKANPFDIDSFSQEKFASYLNTANFPDPELLIRTSGELRISNFLLWQLSYTELYFSDKLWPDFDKTDFYNALHYYTQRERRFGKTSEQLNKK